LNFIHNQLKEKSQAQSFETKYSSKEKNLKKKKFIYLKIKPEIEKNRNNITISQQKTNRITSSFLILPASKNTKEVTTILKRMNAL
jgi:hypothetical protein